LFPHHWCAPAVPRVSVTAPVEALLVAKVPSPLKEVTPAVPPLAEIVGPYRPRVIVTFVPAVNGRSPQVSSQTPPAGSTSREQDWPCAIASVAVPVELKVNDPPAVTVTAVAEPEVVFSSLT